MSHTDFIEQLWNHYTSHTTDAHQISELLVKRGETLNHDHITLHTFNHPKTNVDSLGKIFTEKGYFKKSRYQSEMSHLVGHHFVPTDTHLPSVFISELVLERMSETLQQVALMCIDEIPEQSVHSPEFLFLGPCWQPLDYSTYQQLYLESKYAAWIYAFGIGINHFTIDINHLDSFDTIKEINQFIKHYGYSVDNQGGEIQTCPQDSFKQSCTLSSKVTVEFNDGPHDIASGVYKFIKPQIPSTTDKPAKFIDRFSGKVFSECSVIE